MHDMDVHGLCIQESNTNWNESILQPIYKIFQKTFMHTKLSVSSSIDTPQTNHQPGGTFLATVRCCAAHVVAAGNDMTGLGQWSYHELIGCNGRCYIIAMAYYMRPQCPTIGMHTAYTPQCNILLNQGHLNPDPREPFVTDFITFVQCWQPTHDLLDKRPQSGVHPWWNSTYWPPSILIPWLHNTGNLQPRASYNWLLPWNPRLCTGPHRHMDAWQSEYPSFQTSSRKTEGGFA